MLTRTFIAAGLVATATSASAGITMEFPDHAALKSAQIPLAAYAFQRSAPPLARVCTGSGGSGTVTVTKPVDASSPQLAEASKTKSATEVLVDDQKADGKHVAFKFIGATISSITPQAGGDQPMETIAFSYSNIQWVTVGCAPPRAPARDAGNPFGGSGGYGAGGGGYGRY